MSVQQIIEVIDVLMKCGNFSVEFVPESHVTNYNICFYHKIDNINISMKEIKIAYQKPIPFDKKYHGNTIYLVVKKDD